MLRTRRRGIVGRKGWLPLRILRAMQRQAAYITSTWAMQRFGGEDC